MSKSKNYFLINLQRFLNFGPFFGPFLGTVVENSKVAPGNCLYFPKKIKTLTLIFGSKMYIFGPTIESEGPGMVSS